MDPTHSARWPPGTVTIEDLVQGKVVLQPCPSDDPEQPLNWSATRKIVNFGLVCFYALMTFVLLDIGTVIWAPLNIELGIEYEDLTNSFAANLAGLAVGCIALIPLAIIFGRRSLYIVSTIVQLACAIWQAKMRTTADLIGSNVVSGVAGAVSESIVQMTIADLFFVHQRATMNAIYLAMVTIGTFLAPVAAGYAAAAQGWRWIWWWTTIFLGVAFFAFLFFYEETKYTPRVMSLRVTSVEATEVHLGKDKKRHSNSDDTNDNDTSIDANKPRYKTEKEHSNQSRYPKKSIRERFAFVTLTPGGSPSYFNLLRDFVYLLRFPAVAYTALMYGTSLAWFSIILNTLSIYFAAPPYNFSPSGIGLLNLAPFIGGILSLFVSAFNDKVILILAKRNRGVYEPEMRLWMALPAVVIAPAGMLLYGLTLAKGYTWIVPAIGAAVFGFGFSLISDVSLTYLQDSYNQVIGSALVPVAFIRNGLSMMIVFVLTPWIEANGLYNMFICSSILAWVCYLTTVVMILLGKRMRASSMDAYEQMLSRS